MHSIQYITELIGDLEHVIADDLEDQYLDFKQDPGNAKELVAVVAEAMICFANGKGGTLVLGVKDKLPRPSRAEALVGMSQDFDEAALEKLSRSIYDITDPHLTPTFNWIDLPEARLLAVTVAKGQNPPYTSTKVQAKKRVGKSCLNLTGGMMRDLVLQSEEGDFTAKVVADVPWGSLVSPAEMERLRSFGRRNRAPSDLMDLTDEDLLNGLKLIPDGHLSYAGLLLVGKPEAIQRYIPTHEWRYLKMKSDTDIDITEGKDQPISIPSALEKIETFISANNPVATFEQGFHHSEFKTYPDIAIREAVLNAFVHRDYTIPNVTIVRMLPNALEIENAGGFMSDITPYNILHHPPVHRNRLLAEALNSLNLVNRNNLGVKRMYKSMLEQGKEPPTYSASPQAVRVIFYAQEIDENFLNLISWLNEQSSRAQDLITADSLLILHRLRQEREISLADLAVSCQLSVDETKRRLNVLEQWNAVEHIGYGKGTFYRLSRTAMDKLGQGIQFDRDARLEEEALKIRILSVLKDRPLTNAEIREISNMDRDGVKNFMNKLRKEGLVTVIGHAKGARWHRVESVGEGSLFPHVRKTT